MKSIQQLKEQEPVFLNNWKEGTKMDIIKSFYDYIYGSEEEVQEKLNSLTDKHIGENILFASYGTDNYLGDAFVLFEKDGKLFEVNGSHCSCYELEEQWNPQETSVEAIKFRLEKGNLGTDDYSGNVFSSELKTFLGL